MKDIYAILDIGKESNPKFLVARSKYMSSMCCLSKTILIMDGKGNYE